MNNLGLWIYLIAILRAALPNIGEDDPSAPLIPTPPSHKTRVEGHPWINYKGQISFPNGGGCYYNT